MKIIKSDKNWIAAEVSAEKFKKIEQSPLLTNKFVNTLVEITGFSVPKGNFFIKLNAFPSKSDVFIIAFFINRKQYKFRNQSKELLFIPFNENSFLDALSIIVNSNPDSATVCLFEKKHIIKIKFGSLDILYLKRLLYEYGRFVRCDNFVTALINEHTETVSYQIIPKPLP